MEGNDPNLPPSTPYLPRLPSSSSLLRDISNLKTPKCPSKFRHPAPPAPLNPSPSPRFFTAVKQTPAATPSSSRCCRSLVPKPATCHRKLKAFELEQRTLSSRKEQIRKEQSLKSLAKSLTTWLNFLLQNPASCGCGPAVGVASNVVGLGKREGGRPAGWRCPKRQRGDEESGVAVSGLKRSSGYVALGDSLREVCSLEDLKERMRTYLSLDACKEVLDVMARVVKVGG